MLEIDLSDDQNLSDNIESKRLQIMCILSNRERRLYNIERNATVRDLIEIIRNDATIKKKNRKNCVVVFEGTILNNNIELGSVDYFFYPTVHIVFNPYLTGRESSANGTSRYREFIDTNMLINIRRTETGGRTCCSFFDFSYFVTGVLFGFLFGPLSFLPLLCSERNFSYIIGLVFGNIMWTIIIVLATSRKKSKK